MKKILCSMLLVLLMLLGAVNCLAAEEEEYFIYKNNNFDDHKVGDEPGPFVMHNYNYDFYVEEAQRDTSYACTEIVKIDKDGNSDNLAVKFGVDKEDDGVEGAARILVNYYPIKDDGVVSFSFRVDNFDVDKNISLNSNVNNARHLSYAENNSYFSLIKINGDDVYYRDSVLIAKDISVDTWYRIDFVFDVKTGKATLYFDGTPTSVSLPNNTTNISEVKFHIPTLFSGNDSSWYIDDIRIYEADKVVDDEIIDAQWKRFTDSVFYPGYEFTASRATDYEYMAFRRCEGKKYLVINGTQLFDGSQKIELPTKVYDNDGVIMVPVRILAESYGAKVDWDDAQRRVIINHNGRTLAVTPGENVRYDNDVPSKMLYPVELVNGASCMNLDTLLKFLGKEYIIEENILWFDEPNEFEWHMPLDSNGIELGSVDNAVYNSLFKMCLFDRPTDEQVDAAIKTYSPNNMHPRIVFTSESVAQIKEGMKTDAELKKIVDNLLISADKTIGSPLVERKLGDGKRAAYITTVGGYLEKLAFGYLFSDDEDKKAAYKEEMWRHLSHIGNAELFPDWQFQTNNGLGAGSGAYGFAFAYDWVDWTDEERAEIVDMWKRNVFDETRHIYNCAMNLNGHTINIATGNQALITNSGIALVAIAMYDEDPEYFQDIIRGSLRGSEGGFTPYYPNGEYEEGISYWRYAGGFFPYALKGMQTSMGTDWGRTKISGIYETATFPFRMRGATTGYAFGDGSADDAIIPLLMFCADQTGNKALAQYRKESMGNSGGITDVANWMYDTSEYKQGLDFYDADIFNEGSSTFVLKTGWTRADTSVALHGGATTDAHGHVDVGAFQFDMSGVRFGNEVPREDYNLRGIGHYNAARATEFYPNGAIFNANHFYRTKGEGHNTIVANRQFTNIQDPSSALSYDMNGSSEFIKSELSDISSFVLLDMTDTNDIYQSAIRGVKLDKMNNIVEIQDDFNAKTPTDFMWSMHTYAQIEIAEDGKSAILAQNNQKIKATIINDCDFKFEVLPAEFDETYGTSVKPHFESPNFVYGHDHPYYQTHQRECDVKADIRKLVVRTEKGKDIKNFKLAVTFQPYIEGNTPVPEYVPLGLWENKAAKRQNLASVTVDGKPLDTFESDKYNYSILVLTEKSDIPEITAEAFNSRLDVEILKATTIPGTTNVLLKQEGVTVGQYSFLISPINNTEKFHSDKQIPIFAYEVSSEPQGENGVANLFDGDFATKFATDEQGGNVIMDLGSVIEGNLKLNIACLSGDKRTENFKIEHSVDGVHYTEVFNGHNSGTTTGIEQFDIAGKARYVRVSFYGSSQGAWVSVTEMFVSNE